MAKYTPAQLAQLRDNLNQGRGLSAETQRALLDIADPSGAKVEAAAAAAAVEKADERAKRAAENKAEVAKPAKAATGSRRVARTESGDAQTPDPG